MRVAIITPYHGEDWSTLYAAHSSVILQGHEPVKHFLIADGNPQDFVDEWDCLHYRLPCNHDDAGGTPRALGALSAFSLGYDAVGFLDADCWLAPDHVENMVAILKDSSADAVVATRYIMSQTNEIMYIDRVESNGENMVDTNCWFVTRKTIPVLSNWIVDPAERLFNDRHFHDAMRSQGVSMVRYDNPTVYYKTRWAWHYQHAGWAIPDDAVWIGRDDAGALKHKKHIDK